MVAGTRLGKYDRIRVQSDAKVQHLEGAQGSPDFDTPPYPSDREGKEFSRQIRQELAPVGAAGVELPMCPACGWLRLSGIPCRAPWAKNTCSAALSGRKCRR